MLLSHVTSMFKLAAITPHTPLLIPTIGKENVKKLEKTSEALAILADKLKEQQVETIVIISSPATRHDDAFSINLHDTYQIDFSDFGDLGTKTEFKPDVELIAQIRAASRKDDEMPVSLNSSLKLDYGTGVPLWFIAQVLPNVRIVPISYANLDPKTHAKFGGKLKDIIDHSPKNIAVIASGDLSHCLSTDAPGGFAKEGELYDTTIQSAIKDQSLSKLLSMNEDLREAAKSCAHDQLIMLFGLIERKQVTPTILAYEAPFGVGYLTATLEPKSA